MSVDYSSTSGFGWIFEERELEKKIINYLDEKFPKYPDWEDDDLFDILENEKELLEFLEIKECGSSNYGGTGYYVFLIEENILKNCFYSENTLISIIEKIKLNFKKANIELDEPKFINEIYMW